MSTMMTLGVFTFSISTAAYQQIQRTTSYQWASQSRLGHPLLKHLGVGGPAYQYISPGDETLNLNGTIYPHYNGGTLQTSLLRLSAGLGVALPLIEGSGYILGRWIVEQVQETDSELFSDGTPRKIEFSLSLKRYNEDLLLLL
ncbi:MAG: phage tail protein [Pseudomonadales bacterium]